MKKIWIFVFFVTVSIVLGGCKSIHVGGSGDLGGIHGTGGLSIPFPRP